MPQIDQSKLDSIFSGIRGPGPDYDQVLMSMSQRPQQPMPMPMPSLRPQPPAMPMMPQPPQNNAASGPSALESLWGKIMDPQMKYPDGTPISKPSQDSQIPVLGKAKEWLNSGADDVARWGGAAGMPELGAGIATGYGMAADFIPGTADEAQFDMLMPGGHMLASLPPKIANLAKFRKAAQKANPQDAALRSALKDAGGDATVLDFAAPKPKSYSAPQMQPTAQMSGPGPKSGSWRQQQIDEAVAKQTGGSGPIGSGRDDQIGDAISRQRAKGSGNLPSGDATAERQGLITTIKNLGERLKNEPMTRDDMRKMSELRAGMREKLARIDRGVDSRKGIDVYSADWEKAHRKKLVAELEGTAALPSPGMDQAASMRRAALKVADSENIDVVGDLVKYGDRDALNKLFAKRSELYDFAKTGQNKQNMPYLGTKNNMPVPNLWAKPGKELGSGRPSSPFTDPFAWIDTKYKISKELLENSQGPMKIHTSSDLIAHDDYMRAIPQGSTVKLYKQQPGGLRRNADTGESYGKGFPSNLRLEKAAEKLRSAGIKVQLIPYKMGKIK